MIDQKTSLGPSYQVRVTLDTTVEISNHILDPEMYVKNLVDQIEAVVTGAFIGRVDVIRISHEVAW